MIHLHVGTDTYGCVKNIEGVPIVTRFSMFQMLPITPLQSFYRIGPDKKKVTGIPLLFHVESTETKGIPLAKVDKTSVMMAYIRAIFGAFIILGFLPTLMGILIILTEGRMDNFAKTIGLAAAALLGIGILGGIITYRIKTIPRREYLIRKYCHELLGIAIDPARIMKETSISLVESIDLNGLVENDDPRTALIYELIRVRARIAQEIDMEAMEQETDKILGSFRHAIPNHDIC